MDYAGNAIAANDGINWLLGIVISDSVACGEADRQSDIDCFVVVNGDRTSARRRITDVVADLHDDQLNPGSDAVLSRI